MRPTSQIIRASGVGTVLVMGVYHGGLSASQFIRVLLFCF